MDLIGILLNIPQKVILEPCEDEFKNFVSHLQADPEIELSLISLAWKRNWPILAILATVKGYQMDTKYFWVVWLSTSIDFDCPNLNKYNSFDELASDVIEYAVKNGFTETLYMASRIFCKVSS